MMRGPPSLRADNLCARFGSVVALDSVSFVAWPGERIAILGPNGAGKSTLLRVLAGAQRPSGGEIELLGLDALACAAKLRARLGFLGHAIGLYTELTALENLHFFGGLYDVRDLASRIDSLLEHIGLASRRHDRVETLSRGLQQRLAIARVVLHQPALLLLDEPDTGLDLLSVELLETLLMANERPPTVLLATHNLSQARRLCDRALILRQGRLVAELTTADLDASNLPTIYRESALAS